MKTSCSFKRLFLASFHNRSLKVIFNDFVNITILAYSIEGQTKSNRKVILLNQQYQAIIRRYDSADIVQFAKLLGKLKYEMAYRKYLKIGNDVLGEFYESVILKNNTSKDWKELCREVKKYAYIDIKPKVIQRDKNCKTGRRLMVLAQLENYRGNYYGYTRNRVNAIIAALNLLLDNFPFARIFYIERRNFIKKTTYEISYGSLRIRG